MAYYQAPEFGLVGTWTLAKRLEGLHPFMLSAAGSVVDLGCAEGLITREFSKVQAVHQIVGLDADSEAIANAKRIVGKGDAPPHWKCIFHVANLDREKWWEIYLPQPRWDMVLMLGIYHKMPNPQRTLKEALAICDWRFAIRTPDIPLDLILSAGFRLLYRCGRDEENGELATFERARHGNPDFHWDGDEDPYSVPGAEALNPESD